MSRLIPRQRPRWIPPSIIPPPDVTAHALLQVLGETVFDETFGGSYEVSDGIQVDSQLYIDPQTLDAHIKVGALFTDIDLFNWQSPEIVLLSYGVPGVASINANLQFGIDVGLSAGVAIALQPGLSLDILSSLSPLGLTPKSFVQPNATLSANASGEVEVLGFDLASLSGGVDFTLFVTYGLDTTNPSDVIPLEQFFQNSCLALSGQVGFGFNAEVLGITVFDVSERFPPFEIASTCTDGILTNTLSSSGAQSVLDTVTEAVAETIAAMAESAQATTGSDPIADLTIRPQPGVVIDELSGRGVFVQVVDVSPAPAESRGNLAFSVRNDQQWTGLDDTTLSQPDHISNPALAFTHDQSGLGAAVVTYQAAPNPDRNTTTTNEFLNSQDIRSRYFDGQVWLPETVVAGGDGRFDGAPVVAFNGQGVGITAWTRNVNANPMTGEGMLQRNGNEIMVSLWDAASHTWQAPVQLTSNNTSDGLPAAYVDSNDQIYLTWIQDAAHGDEIMVSTFDGQWFHTYGTADHWGQRRCYDTSAGDGQRSRGTN